MNKIVSIIAIALATTIGSFAGTYTLETPIVYTTTVEEVIYDVMYDDNSGTWTININPIGTSSSEYVNNMVMPVQVQVTSNDLRDYYELTTEQMPSEVLTGKQISDGVFAIALTRALAELQ